MRVCACGLQAPRLTENQCLLRFPRADVRGTRASGPKVSGTSLAEVPLLTSGQPSPMPALDPLQSALLASASDVSLQTLPSRPATTMVVSDKRLFLDISAGATRPMFQAAWQAGMHVLSVDPLCASQLDLFNYSHYEQLLKLSFSGAVWLACVSPPCGDFSTIKLRPGPGPKPIRTREYPVSFPNASASQLVCLQTSLCLSERSVSILLAVFPAGGHTSRGQPPNALSWRQSTVQHYLWQVSASCCCIAACAFGTNVHKRWLFATSFAGLSALACVCRHERSAHVDEAGKRLADGTCLSHGTAGYPSSLATEFMRTVQLLNDTTEPCYCALHDAIQLVPPKDLDPPDCVSG